MLRKIDVEELEYGMYVAELDRDWTETPFLFQGFYVQGPHDLEVLRQYCHYVYVDGSKSAPGPVQPTASMPAGKSEPTPNPGQRPLFRGRGGYHYDETTSFRDELPSAEEAYGTAEERLAEGFEAVYSSGKVNVPAVHEAVAAVMGSVLRNPDAFAWLSRIRHKDNYLYQHLVSTAGIAATFGRHLGLPREEIEQLTVGGLLFDVGMLRMPEELVNKSEPLTDDEFDIIKDHCREGTVLLQESGHFSQAVMDIVMYHHERHDGSGYPQGFGSDSTPLLAQMVGIAECYDALTSDRPHRAALSPHQALKEAYGWRNTLFHPDLVEEFIQSIGIYPAGTFVELSTGDTGVVVGQNPHRRLRPKVVLLRDSNGHPYDIYPVMDLAVETTDHLGDPLEIRRAVNPDELPFELTELNLQAG